MGRLLKFKRPKKEPAFCSGFIEPWIFEDDDISWAAKGILAYIVATQRDEETTPIGNILNMVPPRYFPQAREAIKELTGEYLNLLPGEVE